MQNEVKKIHVGNGLLLINLIGVLLALSVLLAASDVIRLILAVPFLLFAPGYAMLLALFARKSELDGTARVVLSIGMSVVLDVLAGLFLNITPWGIAVQPVLFTIIGIVFLVSVAAWVNMFMLPKNERFKIMLDYSWLEWGFFKKDRIITGALLAAIVFMVFPLTYAIANPRQSEPFTEFYMLGQSGASDNYPTELRIGETGTVMLGVVNHENASMDYTVSVLASDNSTILQEPLSLDNGQSWQDDVAITPTATGEDQKISFLLYRNGDSDIYKELHLWMDVKE